MTRSMVKYRFIEDERARNVTLRKRKASLLKKISELKILCDVDACLVMYEKDDGPADMWPSSSEAHRVIQRFKESRLWSANAMQDHSCFLQKSIARMKKHIEREKEKNLKHLMVKCLFDKKVLISDEMKGEGVLDGLLSSVESEIEVIDDMIIQEVHKRAKNKMNFTTFF
ncbi:hypothetical protein R6Q59_017668 [Mikania micrantha]